MKRILVAITFVFASVIASTISAVSGEAELDEAYRSYQAQLQSGDLRAARESARSAFEEAQALYGARSAQTGRYAAAYGGVLNDLLEYEAASDLLQPMVDGDDGAPLSFDLVYQFGRAYHGQRFFAASERLFEVALQIADAEYGPDSLQAAYAHMQLGKPHLNYSDWRFSGDTLNRVIGTGFGYSAGRPESLDRAEDIFSSLGGHEIELALLDVARAGNRMASNDRRGAGRLLEPALETLSAYGYMDDEVLTLYVDWAGMHLGQWSVNRLQRELTHAFELGALRREGAPIPLARTFAVINRRVCIDHVGGYIEMEFSVNEAGQLPRIRTYETSHPDRWDREVWRVMRGWAYIPGQVAGQVARVNGLHERWDFSGESRDC